MTRLEELKTILNHSPNSLLFKGSKVLVHVLKKVIQNEGYFTENWTYYDAEAAFFVDRATQPTELSVLAVEYFFSKTAKLLYMDII